MHPEPHRRRRVVSNVNADVHLPTIISLGCVVSGYPRPTQTPSPLAGVFYTHNCRASKFCYCACGVAQHIHEWHSAEELATDVAAPTAQALAAAEVPVEKRGHVRRPTPTGGIF